MTNDFTDAAKVPKTLDPKSALYESFNQLRKWRENQLQNFRNKQLIEHKSLLEQSEKNKKSLEEYLENNKGVLLRNQINEGTLDKSLTKSENTLQDSSLTGHFLRCFSDTSGDSATLSQSKDDNQEDSNVPKGTINSSKDILYGKEQLLEEYLKPDPGIAVPKKPKQPFLKKGSGLLRYMPNGKRDSKKVNKSTVPQRTISEIEAKPTVTSKSAADRNISAFREKNHVKFHEPFVSFFGERFNPKTLIQNSSKSSVSDTISDTTGNITGESNTDCDKISDGDNILSNENKELAEFEMLENCAQNSSFNSDSSMVQRVIHGDSIKEIPFKKTDTESYTENLGNENKISFEDIAIRTAKTNLGKCLEEDQAQKQKIQDLMSNINSRITSLQREIYNSNSDLSEEKEDVFEKRSSTPVDPTDDNGRQSPISDGESSHSSLDSIIFVPKNETPFVIEDSNSEIIGAAKVDHNHNYEINLLDKESTFPSKEEGSTIPTGKSELREKMLELENEIKIYQEHNAHLSKLIKEREEISKKLKKEYDDIQKYKENERKKIDLEIENERKQLKRQKETFNRYQKLRKDNPCRKEREEITALRQAVEKLQEELKRQRIKFSNENRRLKNQLIVIEKERDSLKLENMAVEEHCQDLLSAIKARKPKTKNAEVQTDVDSGVIGRNLSINVSKTIDSIENQCSAQLSNVKLNATDANNRSDTNLLKPRVRFNLIPQFESTTQKDSSNHLEKVTTQGTETFSYSETISVVQSETKKTDFLSETSTNVQNGTLYQEIKIGDAVERVYFSGEREIILPSGTRKHVSADGKNIKVFFHNGDKKEIFSDESTIYRYANGIVEQHFPSGLEITKFPNGQIQKIHPDETKEIQFPDGSIQYNYPNGIEKIIDKDGTVLTVDEDGTETIKFTNGEKLIRTPSFKRREYLDGSVKILYNSGRQETRYADGRIRIKNKKGEVVVDSKYFVKKNSNH